MDEVDINNNPYSSIDIYYIPEDIIIKYNLPIYLKGIMICIYYMIYSYYDIYYDMHILYILYICIFIL